MLASTLLIFINTGFVALALSHWQRAFYCWEWQSLIMVTAAFVLMSLLNSGTAILAMDAGARSLRRIME